MKKINIRIALVGTFLSLSPATWANCPELETGQYMCPGDKALSFTRTSTEDGHSIFSTDMFSEDLDGQTVELITDGQEHDGPSKFIFSTKVKSYCEDQILKTDIALYKLKKVKRRYHYEFSKGENGELVINGQRDQDPVRTKVCPLVSGS
jgi:hypothetical protein